jgi:flavin-dependent dehydrogenase
MAMAMQSAVVAAAFISEALTNRDRAENGYRNRHAEMFGPRIAWSRRAAFFLSRPALLDAALRVHPRNAGEFFLRKTRADRDAIEKLLDLSS